MLDKFAMFQHSALDYYSGNIIFVRRNDNGETVIYIEPAAFYEWFEPFTAIEVFPNFNGFEAEIRYLGFVFTTKYCTIS
jgi:hypothetical protein